MKPSLLFLIAFLGAVIGQISFHNGQHYNGLDPAQEMAFKFMQKIMKALVSRDPSVLGELFQPGFIFKGCKGTYNKQQIVSIFAQLAPNAKFRYELKSATDNGDSIKFTLSATGFGPSEIVTDFVLNKADQKLETAVIPACQKTHFLGFVGGYGTQDSAQVMVEKFLARMTRSIQTQDTTVINGLFQPGFTFKGCKETFTKQQIVAVLSQLPVGLVPAFSPTSVQDYGGYIKYTVIRSGLGPSAITADFILNKVDQQLESGSTHSCQTFRKFNDDVVSFEVAEDVY